MWDPRSCTKNPKAARSARLIANYSAATTRLTAYPKKLTIHQRQITYTKFLAPPIFFDFFLYPGIFPLPNGVQITHLRLDIASYQPCTKP